MLSKILNWINKDRDPLSPLPGDLCAQLDLSPIDGGVQLEILNDEVTPMEFVVKVLETYFRLDRETAVRTMLEIHTSGSVRLMRIEKSAALKLIEAIRLEAKKRGYQLNCGIVEL